MQDVWHLSVAMLMLQNTYTYPRKIWQPGLPKDETEYYTAVNVNGVAFFTFFLTLEIHGRCAIGGIIRDARRLTKYVVIHC